MKVFEALSEAAGLLEEKGRERKLAEAAMLHILGIQRHELLAGWRREMTESERTRFFRFIRRLLEGVPIQYLTGTEFFFSRPFRVTPDVLIPRPETEELVLGVLNRLRRFPGGGRLEVVDVGTGSGAIAITLKLEKPELAVTATDLSPTALSVARENAERHQADVEFIEGDLLIPFLGKRRFDCIVSNPPYIPREDWKRLDRTVRDYEPASALVGGDDGLYYYRKLIRQMPGVLKEKALVALEIGYDQREAVESLLQCQFPGAEIEAEKDINGKDRMIFAWIGDPADPEKDGT
jgi:protein-(glutamine-N5) methyltransferase, release factor-specific